MRLSQKVIFQNIFLTLHNFLTNIAICKLQYKVHSSYFEIINLIIKQ